MSNEILQMSQNINAGSSSVKMSAMPNPPPPAPPKNKPGKSKEQEKKEEKSEQEKKNLEHKRLYSRLVHYHRSKHISKYIPGDIKEPRPSDSLESLQAHEELIKGFIHMGSKELVVENMLKGLLGGIEDIAVMGMQMAQYQGLTEALTSDTDYLQPELEEVAIELPDSYVPSPKIRIFLKLFLAAREYAKQGAFGSGLRRDDPPPS
jgi:hypothetical protein